MANHDDVIIHNGINGSTGEPLFDPISVKDLAHVAKGGKLEVDNLDYILAEAERRANKHYGVVDANSEDFTDSGWGLVISKEIEGYNEILAALKPLLNLRKSQVKSDRRFRQMVYLKDKDTLPVDWLARNGTGSAAVRPDKVPYYLLLVGSPEQIPFSFQFTLSVQYAVGRIYFETVEEYAAYAKMVVSREENGVQQKREATFFSVKNPLDRATEYSDKYLVDPLYQSMMQKQSGNVDPWTITKPTSTNKSDLKDLLHQRPPSFLLTTSHGIGFDNGDPRQFSDQGALICSDWSVGPVPYSMYFAAKDIDTELDLQGMIAFNFACFSGGTPSHDHFQYKATNARKQIAQKDFLGRLPLRLLTAGAGAVIAHVDRAWGTSFLGPLRVDNTGAFEGLSDALFRGIPVGHAMDYFADSYSSAESEMASIISNIETDPFFSVEDKKAATAFIRRSDARNYIVLGDPACSLNAGSTTTPVSDSKDTISSSASSASATSTASSPSAGIVSSVGTSNSNTDSNLQEQSPKTNDISTTIQPACNMRRMPVLGTSELDGLDELRSFSILENTQKWMPGKVITFFFFNDPDMGGFLKDDTGEELLDKKSKHRQWRTWAPANEDQKNQVRKAFQIWKNVGINLEFLEVDNAEDALLRIGFMQDDGSWSAVGRNNELAYMDKSQRTMNFGWDISDDFDTALHEVGHALGLEHEHQNPNAGIVWDETAVYDYYKLAPNFWDKETTDFNILRHLQADNVQGSGWDPESCMHYAFDSALIKGPKPYDEDGVSPVGGLSERDKTWVKHFYPPCEETLDGQQLLRIDNSLYIKLYPGQLASYRVEVAEAGAYLLELSGYSDLIMALSEVNDDLSSSQIIAESDTSGSEDPNALIVALEQDKDYIITLKLLSETLTEGIRPDGDAILSLWELREDSFTIDEEALSGKHGLMGGLAEEALPFGGVMVGKFDSDLKRYELKLKGKGGAWTQMKASESKAWSDEDAPNTGNDIAVRYYADHTVQVGLRSDPGGIRCPYEIANYDLKVLNPGFNEPCEVKINTTLTRHKYDAINLSCHNVTMSFAEGGAIKARSEFAGEYDEKKHPDCIQLAPHRRYHGGLLSDITIAGNGAGAYAIDIDGDNKVQGILCTDGRIDNLHIKDIGIKVESDHGISINGLIRGRFSNIHLHGPANCFKLYPIRLLGEHKIFIKSVVLGGIRLSAQDTYPEILEFDNILLNNSKLSAADVDFRDLSNEATLTTFIKDMAPNRIYENFDIVRFYLNSPDINERSPWAVVERVCDEFAGDSTNIVYKKP